MHTTWANTNTPELRIDLPWLMILQQKAQFGIALIYLCVSLCSHECHIMSLCPCVCVYVPKGQQLKSPCYQLLLLTAVLFWAGWPFHTVLSPWTLLCWQDNMHTRERAAVYSKWGERGSYEGDREVPGEMLGKHTVGWKSSICCIFTIEIRSEAVCSCPCLLLLYFMTHFVVV